LGTKPTARVDSATVKRIAARWHGSNKPLSYSSTLCATIQNPGATEVRTESLGVRCGKSSGCDAPCVPMVEPTQGSAEPSAKDYGRVSGLTCFLTNRAPPWLPPRTSCLDPGLGSSEVRCHREECLAIAARFKDWSDAQ
jgi:hypothetical protein